MSAPQSLMMDCPQIMRELGVKESIAVKIMTWCINEKNRVVKLVPPEGRKTWVYREDVMAWIAEHEQKVA